MRFAVSSGIAVRSMPGFPDSGDAAIALQSGPTWLFAVVDALGHGPDAAASASCVCEIILRAAPERPLSDIFAECDRVLCRQRGAVMGAIRFDGERAMFAGVGNIELYGPPGVSAPPALSGVLGGGRRTFREFPLPLGPGQRWILASDGICARDLRKRIPETSPLSPTVAATKLLEWTGRRDDDASLLVMDYALAAGEQALAPAEMHVFTARERIECLAAGHRVKELALRSGWPARAAEELSLLVVELTNNARSAKCRAWGLVQRRGGRQSRPGHRRGRRSRIPSSDPRAPREGRAHRRLGGGGSPPRWAGHRSRFGASALR